MSQGPQLIQEMKRLIAECVGDLMATLSITLPALFLVAIWFVGLNKIVSDPPRKMIAVTTIYFILVTITGYLVTRAMTNVITIQSILSKLESIRKIASSNVFERRIALNKLSQRHRSGFQNLYQLIQNATIAFTIFTILASIAGPLLTKPAMIGFHQIMVLAILATSVLYALANTETSVRRTLSSLR
ncbi:hypothetical protein PbB2_02848 [Candidatus Phycosocius bacilliformis]|uniref:Uncharacterized protein n=1 Tax=Candidatus Phycosocius bacilliformis TaxID=1445552 RepID=A0A2P2EDM8_9PROT|nr:hypothetical protein [Candidatus Phycosocius bacilliformis]GBF59156.1 hypothetical protein PbB2_02848 [Candidatus Phycosocius bacilliformis]